MSTVFYCVFGAEDARVTEPAVAAMQAQGWHVEGPSPADLALSERRHDAYVAMLHDQGHIAVKMLSPKGATAWVAGVPLLFASGPGSEIQKPLAIVVIGGLITSTALTLFLLPILFRRFGVKPVPAFPEKLNG